jgi:Trypsin-like peptidase domain
MIRKTAALAAPIISLLATDAIMSSAHPLTPDQILDRNELSLVRISISGTQGDGTTPLPQRNGIGFFISDTGHIVTALHVVGQDELFEQDAYSRIVGRTVKVEEILPNIGKHIVTENTRNVVLSPYADVALIKVSPKTRGGTYDAIDEFNTCRPSGEIVALVWRGERPEYVGGSVKQAEESNTGGLVRFSPVAGQIEDGDSGGPVFDTDGRLIGVLSGLDLDSGGDAYFVPIAAGESLLFNVAQIRSCYELSTRLHIDIADGVNVAGELAELRCMTDTQFQALANQIEIIFLHNQIQSIKNGDLKEDVGAGLTQYALENRMQDARKEVEVLLDRIKDGSCS